MNDEAATLELLKKLAAAREEGTFSPDLEAEMTAYLLKKRDKYPEGNSNRHLINFHFAAQALHEALIKEKKLMAAGALRSFIPQFVKVCTIETWLMRDEEGNVVFQEKQDAPGS